MDIYVYLDLEFMQNDVVRWGVYDLYYLCQLISVLSTRVAFFFGMGAMDPIINTCNSCSYFPMLLP